MQATELPAELQAKIFRPGGVDSLIPGYISRQQADPEQLSLLPTDYRDIVFRSINADVYNLAEKKGDYAEAFRNRIDAELRQKDIKGFIRESDPTFDRSISDSEYLAKLFAANDESQVKLRDKNVGVYEEVQRLKGLTLSPEEIRAYFQHRVNLEAGGFLSAIWGKALEAYPAVPDEEFNVAAKSIEACIYDRAKELDDPLKPNFLKVYGSTIRMVAEGVKSALTHGNIITDDSGYPAIEVKIRQAEEAQKRAFAAAEFDKLPRVKAFIPLNSSGESHIEVLEQTEKAREAIHSPFSQLCVEAYDRGMRSEEDATPQQKIMNGWMETHKLIAEKLTDEETFKNVVTDAQWIELRNAVSERYRDYETLVKTALQDESLGWVGVGQLQANDTVELAKSEIKLLSYVSQQVKARAVELMQLKEIGNITKLYEVGRDLGILDILSSVGNNRVPNAVWDFQTNSNILCGWEITDTHFVGDGRKVPISNSLPEPTLSWRQAHQK